MKPISLVSSSTKKSNLHADIVGIVPNPADAFVK